MFKNKKNFLIAKKIAKKHLAYLKNIKIDISFKNNQIEYKIKNKNANKSNIIKSASRLMDLMISLDEI
jgi:Fe-S cluster assembly iron-binding protein IscA